MAFLAPRTKFIFLPWFMLFALCEFKSFSRFLSWAHSIPPHPRSRCTYNLTLLSAASRPQALFHLQPLADAIPLAWSASHVHHPLGLALSSTEPLINLSIAFKSHNYFYFILYLLSYLPMTQKLTSISTRVLCVLNYFNIIGQYV